VGKVGTESATFIEPISQRKDGIEAMFAKAKQKDMNHTTTNASTSLTKLEDVVKAEDIAPPIPSTPPTTPSRRKRGHLSSPPDLDNELAKREPKLQKLDAWEDDSQVDYIDEVRGPDTRVLPRFDLVA
jgi:Holliday junction resolvase RusA-like endonuclease